MAIEVVHNGTVHSARVSFWDGRGRLLCGRTLSPGSFHARTFPGSLTCSDCKKARHAGKTP